MLAKYLIALLFSLFFINSVYAKTQTVSELSSLLEQLYNSAGKISPERSFDPNGSDKIYEHNEKVFFATQARIKKEAPILIREINQCKNKYPSENKRQLCVQNSFEILGKNDNLTALQILIHMYDQEGKKIEKNRCQLASDQLAKKIEKELGL